MNNDKIQAYKDRLKAEAEKQEHKQELEQTINATKDSANSIIKAVAGEAQRTRQATQKVKSVDPLASPDDIKKVVEGLDEILVSQTISTDDLTEKFKDISAGLLVLADEISSLPKDKIEFPEMPEQKEEMKVTNFAELNTYFNDVVKAVENLKQDIKFDPTIQVAPADVKVEATDMKPVINGLAKLEKAIAKIQIPEYDNSLLLDATQNVTNAINGLEFPMPNYVLPYISAGGASSQVVLDSSGNVPTNPNNSTLAFSTNSTLGNGVTYDSTVISLEEWTQVQTSVLSDVDGTVLINFCRDSAGADILRTLTIPYIGGSGFQTFSAPAFTPFVRYRFTADEAGQTDFYFDTKFLKVPLSAQVLGADAFISPAMTSSLTRSILVGKTAGGYYNNVAIEPVSNSLDIAIPRSSFGELSTITPTPVVQADFIYNINTDLVDTTVTGSGTVTQASALAVLQTTANASSSAKLQTKRVIKYRPGQGAVVRGTALFTTGVANSEQLFGAGDDSNGFFFGYNGTAFGIMSRVGGVDTWVAQTAWNGDVMNGAGGISNPTAQLLDPTKGNVYQIRYQWLGFGLIEFDIEDSVTGRFVNVHSIPYANNYTTPSLLNPSFPIMWSAKNTTNATNITVKGASCLGQIEGKIEYLGPTNAIGFSKVGVTTTLTNIITIRNKSTFASQTNRTPINILKYTTSVDGNKPAQFNLVKNATLGGTPSWTSISTNTSVVEYDTAGTTVTGGNTIDFATLAAQGSLSNSDVSPTDIILLPGETLTLAVAATATTTDVTSAIRWVEDF